jgi:tetratricopeptide (TPR) repeat protein
LDIKKAFAEGRYLEIIEASAQISSSQEKILLGMSLMRMGEHQQAAFVLAGLESQIEEMIEALKHLGIVYAKMGESDLSRRCIERYLAFRPDDDEALDYLDGIPETAFVSEKSVELARLYAAQGHYELSLDIYAGLDELKTDPEIRLDALDVQRLFIIKTLEEWVGRLNK